MITRDRSRYFLLRACLLLAVAALMFVPVLINSSASNENLPSAVGAAGKSAVSMRKSAVISSPSIKPERIFHNIAPMLMPQSSGPEDVTVYQSDCMTPSSSFELGDTVCIKITGLPGAGIRRLSIINGANYVVANATANSDGQTLTFTLPATAVSDVSTDANVQNLVDNRGRWFGMSIGLGDGFTRVAAPFIVTDPAQAVADVGVSDASQFQVGADTVVFTVFISNNGPQAADDVSLSEAIPANTTFDSVTQGSGPVFNCVTPNQGDSSGASTCTIASLASGATKEITFVYKTTAAAGTEINNETGVTSTTSDNYPANNSSQASILLEAAGGGGTTCVLTCPGDITVESNAPGGANVNVLPSADGIGECGEISNSISAPHFFPMGTTTVDSSSSLGGGSCSFTVTVVPAGSAPTISCPANQTVTAASGATDATVDPGTPTTSPNTGVSVSGVRSDNEELTSPYPIGTTQITWTVTSSSGLTSSCTQLIIVNSSTCDSNSAAPTVTAPPHVSVDTPAGVVGSCGLVVGESELGTPTTTGACTVNVARTGVPAGNFFPVGTTTITYTATDTLGRTATATQTVTVLDKTAPIIAAPADATYVCPSEVPAANPNQATRGVVLDENGNPLPPGPPVDNCGVPVVTVTETSSGAGSAASPKIITRTFTATDGAGNSASAVQTITVIDGVSPTITAPADVTANTGPGATSCDTVVSEATLGTASASDNCSVTVSRSPSGNTFPVGVTTVVWTATDSGGNTSTATQTVTVIDNTIPVVTAPAAVTLFTGPGATSCGVTVANLDATLGTGSATDNCPGVGAVSRSGVPAGNAFPVGTTTLTYSATDAHGNTGTAAQVVTVVDNTAPVISCPADIVLEPTCPSGAIATFADATATDNCGVQSVARTAGPASGSVFPIGTTTVTFTATDIHGNTASCSFTVTVKTVLQTIDGLKAAVSANQQLNPPQKNGLISKLDAARQHFLNGNQNGACSKLADFVNSTQNFIDHGDLSAATGNAWISTANHIRNTIGCTSLPCS